MMKRVFLFLVTNILVVITISVLLNVLGVRPCLSAQGIDYNSLLVFCLVWGMGGAFISLLIARWMAKRAMGVQVLDPNSTDAAAQKLLQTIARLAQGANIPMPEVGVYDSPDINAFATGQPYLELWRRLPVPPPVEEVLRNVPIRHPLLLLTAGPGA